MKTKVALFSKQQQKPEYSWQKKTLFKKLNRREKLVWGYGPGNAAENKNETISIGMKGKLFVPGASRGSF